MESNSVEQRRAVEALRAGVPNRDVVRHLKPLQADLEERYEGLLEATSQSWADGKPQLGLLLEGDFGTGKSHWLEYFQHRALDSNFICSKVVLNKETLLHDLAKVYRACVETAVAPDRPGAALEEISHTYHTERAPHYQDLFEWVHQNAELDPRLAASLFLFERSNDQELRKRIVDEWTGYPMPVPDLKAALRALGEPKRYNITKPQKMQALHQFEFLTRFFRSAGYAGWVLLLDEAEMVSKYSVRQRGKAYAHLAQLMGLMKGGSAPGLATVFTITKDYTGQVLLGRKNDIANIPARLSGTRDESYSGAAEIGMKAIKGKGHDLRPPTRGQVDELYAKVRDLYSHAYQWDAPEIAARREYSSSTGMRQYIRSWITVWDLRRLYDYQAELVTEPVAISYDEDADLQTPPAETADEPVITL